LAGLGRSNAGRAGAIAEDVDDLVTNYSEEVDRAVGPRSVSTVERVQRGRWRRHVQVNDAERVESDNIVGQVSTCERNEFGASNESFQIFV
jgi:hypothetical protein